jgi:hypothetical protein
MEFSHVHGVCDDPLTVISNNFALSAHIQKRSQEHNKQRFSPLQTDGNRISRTLGICKGGIFCIHLFFQIYFHSGSI